MKLVYISTSLPNTCGIATFNDNLFKAISLDKNVNQESYVVALSDDDHFDHVNFPAEVNLVIRKNVREDYLIAAHQINESNTDACILEHEFGIYGGEDGLFVLALMAHIKIPIVAILHTVLKQPTHTQQTIIQQIAKRASKIVVMSNKAIGFLTSIYGIPQAKIKLIGHGVPDLDPPVPNPIKNSSQFKHKKALLTFGLMGRNKGLETVINALPYIVEKYPETVYYVLGSTHPGVIKNTGEEYRTSLIDLAESLNVSKHLVFINKFVEENELHQYLCAADIYITPYINEAQITSGTLSYAIGAGAAVLSTPYWHAQELLSLNKGVLFDFKDHKSLAKIVVDLFDQPDQLATLKQNAYQYGLKLRWPIIGKIYVATIDSIISNKFESTAKTEDFIDVDTIPAFDLAYVKRLTDDTGIIQHSKYGIPNLKEGYCLDDNARALIMALMAYDQFKSKEALDLLPVYLGYIQYMQTDDGNFRNFLSFNRNYLDEVGSEDSFGRTVWAMGCLIYYAPNSSYREFGLELFHKSIPHFKTLEHLRGIANTIIGLNLYLRVFPHDEKIKAELKQLSVTLTSRYKENTTPNWKWFESKMTYDNAILPLALICNYETSGDLESYEIATEALDFLTEKTMHMGYLNPVGNDGWLYKDGEMAIYDQQAIETMAMVILYFKCYQLDKDVKYLKLLKQSYQWFLGENSLKLPLYDQETKGCADGLHPSGVNRNQGAESTLAYLISHLVVFKALELTCDVKVTAENLVYKN